ncbi:TolC family protein [soil metagenome]
MKYILLIHLIMLSASALSAQDMQISLQDVEHLSETYSPEWQQFDYQREYQTRGESAAATRLNPSLNYNFEFLDTATGSEREQVAFIEQTFRTPGHFRNLRQRRDLRVEEIEKEIEAEKAAWMTDIRQGFILVVLAREELENLEEFYKLIERFMDAQERRADEGETSLIDDQLLRMSGYRLSSLIDERRIEMENRKSAWLSRMGLDDEVQDIEFTGSFSELNHTLPDPQELIAILEQSPGRLADRLALERAGQSIELEESRRWPSFDVRAGYKTLNPDFHGFMIGLSLPIPLLNRNSPAIEEARALERLQELRLTSAEIQQSRQVVQALNTIQEYSRKLEEFPRFAGDPEQLISALTAAYEEGEQSLSDVLNTLGLIADTNRTRFTQLEKTYEQIMILEALTGNVILD